MAGDSSVRFDSGRLDVLVARLPERARLASRGMAQDLVADIRANAPVETGRLRDSYTAWIEWPDVWHVGTDVEYAAYQEFGTTIMAPWPHVMPAVERARQRLPRIAGGLFR